ncbi:type II toxin-antitoxin system HicA family toxin [Methanoculleus bourgensis]|jgi:predicted RNA binding protein YcfA (HicA-like mRNA interferase family)|uniref:type II toxin-antitoxin system HicA family toxin n=1 Tax=Methanoculleus bourgensis TaxID=83986 RepID=UPI002FD8C775
MPKLPALTPQKVINILEKKGFVLSRVKGSHHLFYHPETKCRVVVPVHGRDLPTGTLLEILKQAGVGQEEILYHPLSGHLGFSMQSDSRPDIPHTVNQ